MKQTATTTTSTWPYIRTLFAYVFMLAGSPALLFAQTEEEEKKRDSLSLVKSDSTTLYQLGSVTVTVTDRRLPDAFPLSRSEVRMAEINRSDPAAVADIFHEVPAARIQTNSRGEAILYVRNAGERQVAIFLDGAMLNVPWDNRIDLSLVPMNAVGGLIVEKGTPSVLYGANTMGGAVNILSRELDAEGYLTEFRAGGGENGFVSSSLTHLGNLGSFNYIGAVSYSSRDGLPLAAGAGLPFNQIDPELRTNTDSRIIGGYGRGEYHLSPDDAIGLSVNIADARKGVAPEGNKDPATESVRFWRYPDWRNITLTGTYDLTFGGDAGWNVRGALWGTTFTQRIEQYGSVEYKKVEAAQTDRDRGLGGRAILSRQLGEEGRVSVAFNELFSNHNQVDSEFDSTGSEIEGTAQEYAQHTYSIGAEYGGKIGSRINAVLGASLDGMITLKSGDKPGQDPFMEPGLTGGATYSPDSTKSVRLTLGKKSRFPSMRELYGEALRRFLINPDLKPESSWNGEIGFEGRFSSARLEIAGFTQWTSNTIDQRSLDTLGGTKRQRINLKGSRIFGLEIAGSVSRFRPFRLNGHATWTSVRAITAAVNGSDSLTFLSEKPEILATINLGYDFPFGLRIDGEAVYTGRAYTLNDDNEFEALAASLSINGRIAYQWTEPVEGIDLLEVYARVDNAADAVILPQFGLPGPGREIRGGIKVAL